MHCLYMLQNTCQMLMNLTLVFFASPPPPILSYRFLTNKVLNWAPYPGAEFLTENDLYLLAVFCGTFFYIDYCEMVTVMLWLEKLNVLCELVICPLEV